MGSDTSENRSSDTVKLLNYGFNSFKINIIKKRDEVLGKVRIEGGKKDFANIVLLNDATELLKNTQSPDEYQFNIKIDKLKAPIKPGEVVGKAEIIDGNNNIIDEVEVTINEEVKKANFLDYFLRNVKIFTAGKVLIKQ